MLMPNKYFCTPRHAVDEFALLMDVEINRSHTVVTPATKAVPKVYGDPDTIEAEIMEHVRGEHEKAVRRKIAEVRRNLLPLTDSRSQPWASAKGGPEIAVPPTLPYVQRLCEECKQLSLFRPVWI